ncbi:uncharacterized protein [Argopecten irradians]|uniref:uncharacterized protein isoform X1 n=3 Tax=Argopecten irradians TaxID=31199 RepID=UPI0037175DAE
MNKQQVNQREDNLDLLSEEDVEHCKVNKSAWKCSKCQMILSRKQTLKTHLFIKHKIRAGNPAKRYKLYETDPDIPVPSSTSHNWKKKECIDSYVDVERPDHHESQSHAQSIVPESLDAQHQVLDIPENHNEEIVVHDVQQYHDEQIQIQESDNDSAQSDLQNDNNQAQMPDVLGHFNELVKYNELDVTGNNVQDFNDTVVDMDLESDADYSNISSDSEQDSDPEDSNCDEDETEEVRSITSPPLYIIPPSDTLTKAPLTHLEHLLLVSGYASACNLSGVAFQKLLDVIRLHIPSSNLCETGTGDVKQKLGFGIEENLNFFYCCPKCGLLFKNTDLCETPGCGQHRGGDDIGKKTGFVTCNIKKQLQEILERNGIIKKIQAELQKPLEKERIILSDITTGQEYLKLKADGNFLDPKSSKFNVTLSWNTDGIPLFKSSGISLWPVYLTINELPPKERLLKKNILVWGIWQGTSKPGCMNGFLSPFVKDMTELFNKGVDVNGQTWKALLLTATMDLQARAYVLNMTQHNGRFGCLYCKEEGSSVPCGGGHCRSYPFRNVPAPVRNSSDLKQDASAAATTSKPSHGILGTSVISFLPLYAIEKHIVVDYMHGILLGIVKKLLSLWFDGANFKKEFFIGNHLDQIDKHLKRIKPPYLISRLPRKMKNNYHRWKASELRSWLLHYSLPCLSGFLPEVFLEHFACLVEGVYLLLKQNVSSADIDRAESLLLSFYQYAGDIYGDQFLGLNVHNLQHYASCVRMWGPLWAYSCFGYESCNGDILKTVHGKGNVCAQIFWAMQAQKRLERESNALPKGELRSFLQKLLAGGAKLLPKTIDGYKCDIVPPMQNIQHQHLCNDILTQLQTLNQDINQLAKVNKIIIDDIIFYCQASSKVKKRNSYMVSLDNPLDDGSDVFGVEYYIVEKSHMKVFAVGTTYSCSGTIIPGRAPHVQKVTSNRTSVVVPVHRFKELLIFVDLKEERRYVSKFPNFIEKD